jgi:hypothetical protein
MKKSVFIVLSLLVWGYGFGQQLQSFEEGGKYGFRDERGEVVIPAQYQKVFDFFANIARVQLNDKWGCINKTGKIVTPFDYDEILEFSNDGFAMVKNYTKLDTIVNFGYIDTTGKVTRTLLNFNIRNSFEDLANGFVRITVSNYPLTVTGKQTIQQAILNSTVDYPVTRYAFPYIYGQLIGSGPIDVRRAPKTYYLSKTNTTMLYRNLEMIDLETTINPLTSMIIRPISWRRSILTSDNRISASVKFEKPYVVLRYVGIFVNSAIPRPFFYNQLEFVKYSENDGVNCADDLSTLVVLTIDNTGSSQYNQTSTNKRTLFVSRDIRIDYYDLNEKKAIGYDLLRVPKLPARFEISELLNLPEFSTVETVILSENEIELRPSMSEIFKAIESHFND